MRNDVIFVFTSTTFFPQVYVHCDADEHSDQTTPFLRINKQHFKKVAQHFYHQITVNSCPFLGLVIKTTVVHSM